MTPETEAFLNALVPVGGSVSTDYTDEIYALLEPLHSVLEKVEAHIAEIDRLRRQADAAETDPRIYGFFERFKNTIDATRIRSAEAKRAVEAISDVAFQLDTYARDMRETLARKEDMLKLPPRPAVRLTMIEHEALKATVVEANARLAKALTRIAEMEKTA